MNYRAVLRQLGLLLCVIASFMAVATAVEWLAIAPGDMRERWASWALLASTLTTFAAGGGMVLGGRRWTRSYFGQREAVLLTSLSWAIGSVFAALPFYLWSVFDNADEAAHPFTRFASCYFEAMSGFTTTGSTILSDIEALPRGLLLWRSMTHWLGGVGIVVLFVAVLPMVGVTGKRMYLAESGAAARRGLRPRIREAAMLLFAVYLVLCSAQWVLLMCCGLSWLDAACETMGTVASGGFSTKNASIAGYHSAAVDWIVIAFMWFSGVNFALFVMLKQGRWSRVWKDDELRWYAVSTLLGCAVVAGCLWGQPIRLLNGETVTGLGASIRHGTFQLMSLRTDTGYATADVNPWGFVPKLMLVLLMTMGACTGSTGGGIKVVRVLLAVRIVWAYAHQSFRGGVVTPIRLSGQTLDAQQKIEPFLYIAVYAFVVMVGGVLVRVFEGDACGIVSAMTASAACMANAGPGLHLVGTAQNFGWMTDASQWTLSAVMLLGRLEVFAVLALFMRGFWSRD